MGAGPEPDAAQWVDQVIPGATPVDVRPGAPKRSAVWLESAAKKFTEVGTAAKAAGLDAGSFPFEQAATALATGLAVGGVVGAIVALGSVVAGWLTNGANNSNWQNVPASVRNWPYWPQEFVDMINAMPSGSQPGTKEAAGLLLLQMWLERYDYVIGYNRLPGPAQYSEPQTSGPLTYNAFYSGYSDNLYAQLIGGWAAVEAFYEGMAIDFPATMEIRRNDATLTGRKDLAMRTLQLKYAAADLEQAPTQDNGGAQEGGGGAIVALAVGAAAVIALSSQTNSSTQ